MQYNFDNVDPPLNSFASQFSDFPLQSPITPVPNSFLLSSNMTTSPDIHGGKKYEINHDELSPQSQVLHAYQTPINQNAKSKVDEKNYAKQSKLDLPKQMNEQAKEQKLQNHQPDKNEERFDEIQLLKQHLKQKYKHYSDQQLDDIIQKFINEYVQKLSQQQQNGFSEDDDDGNDMINEDFVEDQSRDSLSTNLDWNDGQELMKYCQKQKRIQEVKDFRPSQYFGAVKVDHLEDGIEDSRIDELFLDCFGIKPKPKKKEKKQEPKSHHQRNQANSLKASVSAPSQVVGNNNSVSNDQSCKIILNFYNQFQIMNQENFAKSKPEQLTVPVSQVYAYSQQNKHEDECAMVLQDKSNKLQKSSQVEVLHQDCKDHHKKDSARQHQKSNNFEQIKQFMSPKDTQQPVGNNSKGLRNDQENSEFPSYTYKTDDSRQNLLLSHKGYISKTYQTQINSPNSQGQIYRHLYNQSMASTQNPALSNQSLSHQLSMGNLTVSDNADKQGNLMPTQKQQYKNILYKQNPNHLSISSSSSIENKPKQMNKLSYLVAKSLPDGTQKIDQDIALQHLRINSVTSVNSAPKPPTNQTAPITAKTGRNSKDNNLQSSIGVTSSDSFCNEASPRVSPKQATLLQMHQQLQPHNINQFKVNSQTFTMQQANSTFAPQSHEGQLKPSASQDDFSQTLKYQSVESFKKQNPHHSDGQGSAQQKTLGRNQSQNFSKTQSSTLSGVQSFLINESEPKKFSKDTYCSKNVVYTETEMESPRNVRYETQTSSLGMSSRPQTSINGNFNTGINQYMNNAQNLGKPPSKISKGFLSHTSSAKNLQLGSKALVLNSQTAMNSSRKMQPSHYQSIQHENPHTIISQPQSTRHASSNKIKFGSKPTSLQRERNGHGSKSNERTKLKSSQIKNSIKPETTVDSGSVERKRQLYKSNKVTQEVQAKFFSGNQQSNSNKSTNGRNQANALTKGKSFAATADLRKPLILNYEPQPSARQDSSSRTMMKINKSLDKISQIFMNAPGQGVQYPQSTKNSSNVAKVSEIISQINNYQSMIKKAKVEKENDNKHYSKTRQQPQTNAHSKTRKDLPATVDANNVMKKTVETYKKYLSSNQYSNTTHSFK